MILATIIYGCGTDELVESEESAISLASQQEYDGGEAIAYSYIVTFRSDSHQPSSGFASFAQEVSAHLLPIKNRMVSDPGILQISHLAAVSLAADLETKDDSFAMPIALRRQWTERAGMEPIGSITQVDFKSLEDARRVLTAWKRQGRIWFAEPNYTSRNHSSFGDYVEAFENIGSNLYWHEKVKSLEAIKWLSENKSIQSQPIIAVMDSGVDPEHPSLRNRMWRNESIGAADCANDLHGCNTTAGKRDLLGNGNINPFAQQEDKSCPPARHDPRESDSHCSHGTHVAGIIAGFDPGNANQSMMGICPMCRIMAIQIVSPASGPSLGTINDSSIIRGLHYVGRFRTGQGAGVRVVNASFGKFQRSRAVGALIRNLYQNGTLVVAAAGNEDTMLITFPAGFRDVLSVSNLHTDGQKHRSSNFGAWVDIAAPGGQINSTIPGSSRPFERKSGTSMSAPIVAGVAGLMLAAQPELSAQALRDTLVGTADPRIYSGDENSINNAYYVRVAGRAERIPLLGSGVVNALNAVRGESATTALSATARKRVDSGCGIAHATIPDNPISAILLWLGALLPLGVVLGSRLKPML